MCTNQMIGAAVPFVTYEAEAATLLSGAVPGADYYIGQGASGKQYVSLPETGSAVEFVAKEAADRLTVRYGAPHKTVAALDVAVNGTIVSTLLLNTVQCHGVDNGRVDAGARRFTEASILVSVVAGDRIRLINKEGDIWIDLIDLETAPAPLPQPDEALSIVDFGATPDDDTDDSDAIEACIRAAEEAGKHVYVPAGTFLQSRRIAIPMGMRLMGAGAWYSNIEFITPGTTFTDTCGYAMKCGNVISGIHFNDRASYSRRNASILFHPFGSNQILEDCWFSNVGCVFGWDRESCYTVMRRCRIIGTYFDGTHWGDGRYYKNEMHDNYFRGVGDDSVAQVNRADMGLCEANYAHHNTIVASYWGRGMSVVGGKDLVLRCNRVESSYNAGLMFATEELTPSYSWPIDNILVEDNVFTRCGHTVYDERSKSGSNHATIHVWLATNDMTNVTVRHNEIADGLTEAIHLDKTSHSTDGITFEDNTIIGFD